MGISISKSPNWVPGKGLVFSNQRGGSGGMNMGGGSSPTPPTPATNDIYTKMLLHFNDSSSATTFADAALSPLTQTKSGTVTTSTVQSKFGGSALYLNGTSTNKLQFANPRTNSFNLGTGNFTMEGWFYITALTNQYQSLIELYDPATGTAAGPVLLINPNNKFAFHEDTTNFILATNITPTLNQWYHVAAVRNNGTMKVYVNGVSEASTSISSTYRSSYSYVNIGNFPHVSGGYTSLNGYVDSVRIQIGEAAYTSNFTPSAIALTANSYTKLLVQFDGSNTSTTVTDSSSEVLTGTAYGTAQISTEQFKFGGSSLKITGGNGSNYVSFEGTKQPIALLDKPFCIEGWFYLNVNNIGYQPLIAMASTGDFQGPIISLETNNTLSVGISNGSSWAYAISTSFVPTANAWHHVALIRDYAARPIKLYCNGVLRGTNTTTASIFTGENVWAGHYPYYPGGARTLNGYIDEVRIVVGKNPYSGEFTPQTTAYENGSADLLLHFDGTNGSTTVTDSSASPNTVTAYSGATISTTKSKFGGSAMSFTNGSKVVSTNNFTLGNSDFAVDCWINLSAMSAGNGGLYNTIFDYRTTDNGNGIWVGMDGNRKIQVWSGGIFLVSRTTIELNTWYHVAVSRYGSNFALFINGMIDTVYTSFSTNMVSTGVTIGNHALTSIYGNSMSFNGYIDEFRVRKGVSIRDTAMGYAAVPTAQVSASSNTKLLLNFNTDYSDSSTNPATITAYGGATLSTAQSKFGGKSMKFTRSTGSRLTVSNVGGKLNMGSNDFCIETWLYLNSLPGGSWYPDAYWLYSYGPDNSADGLGFVINSTNIIFAPVNDYSKVIDTAHGFSTNTWYHVALVRKGNTVSVYINGVLKQSASISGAVYTIPTGGANGNLVCIGSAEPMAATSGNFDGYLDDFRVTIGDSVYDIVPTSEFSLLTT